VCADEVVEAGLGAGHEGGRGQGGELLEAEDGVDVGAAFGEGEGGPEWVRRRWEGG
jgi:hypothetical protein